MSTETQTTTETKTIAFDDLVVATRAEEDDAKKMVETLVRLAGDNDRVVKFDRNITRTIDQAIAAIDDKMTKVMSAVMHHEKFRTLEGRWRGLNYLVKNTFTGTDLRLKVMNATKDELFKDFDKTGDFVRSQLFKKVHDEEYDKPGGEPFGSIVCDYDFGKHPKDIQLMRYLAQVGAASLAPILTAASPRLFNFDRDDFRDLMSPHSLKKVFDSVEYAKWNSLRESEDSRYLTLCMPRVLARDPYGVDTSPTERFVFQEAKKDDNGKHMPMGPENFCWMNAAYAMAVRMTTAFRRDGIVSAIRGKDSGGKVENLPSYVFNSDDGDLEQQCPTEIAITGRRDFELAELGFCPLSHYKNTDYAVFFGGQTIQKAKKYEDPDTTKNAEIATRLPYIMIASRFSHYIKKMARDMVGSFKEEDDIRRRLQRWINNYVNASPSASEIDRARRPLKEAKIVVEQTDRPGFYKAELRLLPWMQMEGLTAAVGFVANLNTNQ